MQHTISPKRKMDTRLIWGVVAAGVLLLLVVFVVVPWLQGTGRAAAPDYWPTDGWRTSTPEAQGMDSTKLAGSILAWREQGIPIHSLFIVRNGYVVADATFYPYDGQSVHDVASVTKSVMTTLIGIAVDQGHLKLDDPMVSFFPDRTIANLDARKEAITVGHLASMSSGLQCTRDGYTNASVQQMHGSADFVQFALDRPMVAQPGSLFVYCSPSIHLLSPILQQATGLPALEFARQHLFTPLGIGEATWEQDPQGYYAGWGDLALMPEDMAKIGFLFLHEGQWEGEQVISRDWVREATSVQASAANEDAYGYGWWLSEAVGPVFRADGRLGQYIIALPDLETIIVTTGGGFEIEAIAEDLLGAFGEEAVLPDNPEGVARLQEAVAAVALPPVAQPVPPLPDMARAISGQTYTFERNALDLDSIAITFDGSAEAVAAIGSNGLPPAAVPVGLDGLYRTSTALNAGQPVGLRGQWIDDETFALDYNAFASNDRLSLRFRFHDGGVTVSMAETPSTPALEFEGQQ